MLIPAHRIIETDSLIAFEHPQPAYPVHILIVPRRSITGLVALKPGDSGLLNEVIEIVKSLVVSLDLESSGYRLIKFVENTRNFRSSISTWFQRVDCNKWHQFA